ncbi:MAG: 5-formyltetrahydrofolate cyclo-ligase [bacterium]
MLSKKELRARMASLRDSVPPAERRAKSRAIADRLFGNAPFAAAGGVMFYASFRSEVETGGMIERALSEGRRVGLPKVDRVRGRLDVFEIEDPAADLEPGAWGISEPSGARCRRMPLDELEAVVCPGLAFDARGNRLGWGGGYYDSLFRELGERARRIAVAFDLQVIESVPAGEGDERVDAIITESGTIEG